MKNDMKDVTTWIPRDIFEAYCGTNTEGLLKFYDKAVEKKNQLAWDLNWLGLFFLPAWLGYRKQWKLLATITIVISLTSFVEAFFDIVLPVGGFLGMFIVFGFICNGFLLGNAHSEFIKLKTEGMDNAQIKVALQGEASSSVPLAIVAQVGYIFIIFATVILADVLFGFPA